ncbi:MAG TPA: ACP S-malonyltransferase [Anaerolineae bacterium]|nr:ACP S-malonyltransferase [Anaerolineae bacterium]
MSQTAFLFPGQGSQYVGMGRNLYEAYPEARTTFDQANEVLGFALSDLCFNGPEETLNDTINTQPAIFVTSVALLKVLESNRLQAPGFVAGHSLGEYSALAAAGAMDFAAGLQLVRERGRLMKEAGERSPGGMAAVLGLEAEAVDEVCRQAREETGGVIQVANYNSPGQIVISGDFRTRDVAIELAKAAGARRVVPLAVSIAAHSPLMECIADEFRQAVEATEFRRPTVPVVANVSAAPLESVEALREELVQQLTSPVRWVESIRYMTGQGVTKFVEIGPKDVLTRLMKRIDKSVPAMSVGDVTGVKSLTESR